MKKIAALILITVMAASCEKEDFKPHGSGTKSNKQQKEQIRKDDRRTNLDDKP